MKQKTEKVKTEKATTAPAEPSQAPEATTAPAATEGSTEAPKQQTLAEMIKALDVPPRGERRVKLRLQTSGEEIECSIQPTLVHIRRDYKAHLRKRIVLLEQADVLTKRIKSLVEQSRKLREEEKFDEADQIVVEVDNLYDQAAELETKVYEKDIAIAKTVLHLPMHKGKLVREDQIDWDACEEGEISKANTYFTLP